MQPEFLKSIGPTCDGTETCEPSHQQPPMIGESMLSAEDSRVRTSAQRERNSDLAAHEADCGVSSPASFAFYDRDSSSWKTQQRSFIEGLATFSETWPRSGLMLNGKCFPRAPSVRHIHAKECFSLPTLTVVSCEHPGRLKIKSHQQDCISGALSRRDNWKTGGQYNPSHAAWLMAFPESWTDLGHTETPSSPRSPNGSADAS